MEQPGGPLAMEEFDKIKRIEKQIPPATVSLEEFVSIINGNYCITNTLLLYKNLNFAQLPCARQCLIK